MLPNENDSCFEMAQTPPLQAYLKGEPDYRLGALNEKPYYMKTRLKKLIQDAREVGFKPDPNRWLRSEKQNGEVVVVYFDAKEAGNRNRNPTAAKSGTNRQ